MMEQQEKSAFLRGSSWDLTGITSSVELKKQGWKQQLYQFHSTLLQVHIFIPGNHLGRIGDTDL